MGIEYPAEVLHIQPNAIPAIRTEYATTLAKLKPLLNRMQTDCYITRPWLGDPVSIETTDYYNKNVVDAADGPYQALVKWADQIQATHDTLVDIEVTYRRTEGANAALWGRNPT